MKRLVATVAIVDDDAAVRKALMRLLEAAEYQVHVYESATQFLNGLQQGIPQCLVVDLQMPNMSGLELQHQLRRLEIDIATVVITAHDEPDTREKCVAAGAAAYLLKPIRKVTLISAIRGAIAD